MSDYVKVPTTAAVWSAVMEAHKHQLHVFCSFSNPFGGECGSPKDRGEMVTVYGFISSDTPLIGARTTWDIEHDAKGQPQRRNETHVYWLCA